MEGINLEDLKNEAFQNAVKHGWYDDPMSFHAEMMLIVTELGEVVNADRKERWACRDMFEKNIETPQEDSDGHWKFCYETFIKDTVEDELADCFIRILSFCGNRNINIMPYFFREESILQMHGYMQREKGMAECIFSVLYTIMPGEYNNIMISLVRLIALARILNIDLFWHIKQKMKYNELRPYKNGKKY